LGDPVFNCKTYGRSAGKYSNLPFNLPSYRLLFAGTVICALGIVPAAAAETSSYSYDALGRLISTSNSGGPRTGNTVSSRYDPAGNRAAVAVNQALPAESTAVTFAISGPGTVTKGSTATFSIAKTGSAAATVTVNYATSNGTATSPAHYAGASGTLSFRPWETLKTIGIPVVEDGLASPSRSFSMGISSPSAGGAITTASATATIAGTAGNAPVANSDSAIASVCAVTYINVTANDTDPNGGYPLTVVSITAPGTGTASIYNASTIRYQISYNGPGSTSLSYTVRNTAGYTSTAVVQIDIRDNGGCQ
jgi:YD repeat-containing protein